MGPLNAEVRPEPEHPMRRLMREIDHLDAALTRVEQAAAAGGPPYDAEVHEAARRLLASADQVTVGQAASILAAENRNTFHFVLTLTGTVDGRQRLVGDQGTVRLAGTDTRAAVCDRLVASLRAQTEKQTGKPFLDTRVLFFDLQPNVLPRPKGRS
jgi:hypothetical protein